MTKPKTDITELIVTMQQHLALLEKKIDILLAQTAARAEEPRPPRRDFRQHDDRRDFRRPDERQERTMHKVICADCRKECEVPFRPTGDRPVYCRDCFAKRKMSAGGGQPSHERHERHERREPRFHERRDSRPGHDRHEHRPKRGGMREFGEKKVRSFKKRKKRS